MGSDRVGKRGREDDKGLRKLVGAGCGHCAHCGDSCMGIYIQIFHFKYM